MNSRKYLLLLICTLLFLSVSGCSSASKEDSIGSEGAYVQPTEDAGKSEETSNVSDRETAKDTEKMNAKTNMVIYTADLDMEVKEVKKTNRQLEDMVKKHSGYIVESTIYQLDNQNERANLTIRIPQKGFNQFLTEVENLAVKIHQRSVSGSDVSEEYVDLESRLNSKKAVEKRLLEFMQKAQTTEDLLKISTDLAAVQEDIEQITGRIKYLDNQVALSTVNLSIEENKIKIPEIENKELNTWEKTKKQFLTSINYILAAGSGLVVLVIGNLPIILLLGLVTVFVIYIIKRTNKRE